MNDVDTRHGHMTAEQVESITRQYKEIEGVCTHFSRQGDESNARYFRGQLSILDYVLHLFGYRATWQASNGHTELVLTQDAHVR